MVGVQFLKEKLVVPVYRFLGSTAIPLGTVLGPVLRTSARSVVLRSITSIRAQNASVQYRLWPIQSNASASVQSKISKARSKTTSLQ